MMNETSSTSTTKRAARVAGFERNVDGVRAYMTAKGVRFSAQVRSNGKALSKSFDTREEAKAWRAAQESGKAETPKPTMLLVDCFAAHKAIKEKGVVPASWEAMKMQYDRIAESFGATWVDGKLVGGIRVDQVTETLVADEYRARLRDGGAPSTNLSNFVRLRNAMESVARANRTTWGNFDPLNDDVREYLTKEKLIAESTERTEIFSEEQLAQLRDHFKGNQLMLDIMNLANANGFRRGEIERMTWSGFNEVRGVLVLDRKDSSKVKGRRRAPVPLMPESIAIIKRQPRIEGDDRIFPISGDTFSGLFGNAVEALGFNVGVEDEERLCFHSLRHTGLTRIARNLKKLGLEIIDLMAISGHKSIRHLQRYLHNNNDRAHEIASKLRGFQTQQAHQLAA